jgi:hypothetical protein
MLTSAGSAQITVRLMAGCGWPVAYCSAFTAEAVSDVLRAFRH